jgi:hypothetical protein
MQQLIICFPLVLGIVCLAVVVYLVTLAGRFVTAVERIADKFERGPN